MIFGPKTFSSWAAAPRALLGAAAQLENVLGPKIIVLISDGESSCGDPCPTAEQISADLGVDFRAITVGFQAPANAETELQCIADATGGEYFAADDTAGLEDAIDAALTGQLCTDSLLVCYAPELRFHVRENFYPMDPLEFIEGSELWWSESGTTCEDDRLISSQPTAERIQARGYVTQARSRQVISRFGFPVDFACWPTGDEYHSREYTRPYKSDPAHSGLERAIDLDINEGFYLRWTDTEFPEGDISDDGATVSAPVLATTAINVDGTTSLVYWFFYGYDSKANASIDSPSNAIAIGDQAIAHEGDWEKIQVNLDANNEPVTVQYFGHNCKTEDPNGNEVQGVASLSWDQTPKTGPGGTHPIGYVAEGAHATYPFDNFGPNRFCNLPSPEAGSDETRWQGNGAVWQTWNKVVEASATCWYGFGGAWGDKDGRLDTGIEIGGLLTHATGPDGPPYNADRIATVSTADCLGEGNSELESSLLSVGNGWLDPATARILATRPNTRLWLSLRSVETPLATAISDASGTAEFNFEIPAGTSPGLHQLVVRDENGEMLATSGVGIDPPDNCWASDASIPDVDGDLVADTCDPNPNDGPLADADFDFILNDIDNCPLVPNRDQAVIGVRSDGIACDPREGVNPLDFVIDPANYPQPPSVADDSIIVTQGATGNLDVLSNDGDTAAASSLAIETTPGAVSYTHLTLPTICSV